MQLIKDQSNKYFGHTFFKNVFIKKKVASCKQISI